MQLLLVLIIALVVATAAFNGIGLTGRLKFHSASSILRLSDVARDTSNQVFIGNLPFTVDENDLTSLITGKFGASINSLKIIKDKMTGRSRGFGYVTYSTKEEAEAAVSSLGGLEVDGRAVKVDLVVPKVEGERRERSERPPRRDANEFKAFIGNLDFKVSEADIMSVCEEKFGADFVKRVDLVYDRDTRKFRGFGYIIVSSDDDVQKVIGDLNGAPVLGRNIRVDLATKRSDGDAPRDFSRRTEGGAAPRGEKFSIYLGNLSWETTQEVIESMVSDYVGVGSFTNVRIATDRETGKPRGFCHVDFKDAESMERALVELEGIELYDRTLKVDKAQAKPKTDGFRSGPRTGGRDRYADSDRGGSFNSW